MQRINLLLITSFLSLTVFSQSKKVAVFDPTGIQDATIIEVAREMIIDKVVSNKKYVLLEREKIKQVLKENAYQQGGNVDDSQISDLGRQMGADYVCVSIVRTMSNTYFISARLVDVLTAQAVSSGIGRDEDIFTAIEQASNKLMGVETTIKTTTSTTTTSTTTEIKLSKPKAMSTKSIRKVAIKKYGKYSDQIEQIVDRTKGYLAKVTIEESPQEMRGSYLDLWAESHPCDYVLLIDQELAKPMLPKKIQVKFIGVSKNAKVRTIKDIYIKVKKEDDIDLKAKELAEKILLYL